MSDEIIAIFRADIEQYKKDVTEAGAVTGGLNTQVDAVNATTQKYSKTTKTAAGSIGVLSRGLGGISGLLGITGRLFGVNTEKLEGLIFASQQFSQVARKVADAQKLVSASSLASIPIIGAIVVAIGAAAAVLIRYQDQLFGVSDAQKEKTKADNGALISDEKLRNSYNESLKTIRDLGIEYRLVTGQINEYQASVERLRISNKSEIDAITKDTKIRTDEIIGFWAQVKLGAAQALGVGGIEAQKMQDELTAAINDRNQLIKLKGEELTEAEKVELQKRFNKIDEDTKRLLKANQDRLDKEKEQRKKAAAEALKELREFQEDRRNINVEAAEENLLMIRKQGEVAREEYEKSIAAADDLSIRKLRVAREEYEKHLKKTAEDEKKLNEQRIEDAKMVADTIFKAQQEGFDKRQELLTQEIDAQDKNIATQQRLAEAGLQNTLAFEEKRAADLQRQQQKEAEQQKKIKLLETFLNSLAEYSKSDPKTALSKALLQVALATAASAVFAEEGGIIGEIGTLSGRRKHRGGGDVLLHAQTGEGILSRREMDNLGKRNFHLLKDAARFPIRDDVFAMPKLAMAGGIAMSNSDVVKELKALQHIVKNKRETHWEVNKFGDYVTTSIENGVTEITKGKLRKPRLRG